MSSLWTRSAQRPSARLSYSLSWQHDDGARLRAEVSVRHYPAASARPAETMHDGPRGDQNEGGSGSRTAPRLLLVHGFRGDHHGMQLIAESLPEYELFVPDLPGFGGTPPVRSEDGGPVRHRLEVFSGAVGALARALELSGEDVLLGHSFGSLVAAQQACRAGREASPWRGLVLMAPLTDPLFRSRLLPGALGVELYYRTAGLLPETLGDRLIASPAALAVTNRTMIRARDPQVRAYIREQHRLHFNDYAERRTLLEAYRASSGHTVADVAEGLSCPTLLLAGAQDSMSTPSGRRRLRRLLPGAQLETLRGVGHLMHYEKPAQAARAVRRFLASL